MLPACQLLSYQLFLSCWAIFMPRSHLHWRCQIFHLPLNELTLLCGETFTVTSASDVIPRSISEYFLLLVWTSKSPQWRRFTVSRVPIWHLSDLPIANGDTWSNDCRLGGQRVFARCWHQSVRIITIIINNIDQFSFLLTIWLSTVHIILK